MCSTLHTASSRLSPTDSPFINSIHSVQLSALFSMMGLSGECKSNKEREGTIHRKISPPTHTIGKLDVGGFVQEFKVEQNTLKFVNFPIHLNGSYLREKTWLSVGVTSSYFSVSQIYHLLFYYNKPNTKRDILDFL